MNNIIQKASTAIARNSSTILSLISVAGVAATTITAIYATPKAIRLLKEAEEEKGEGCTKLEAAVILAPIYTPTMLIGVSTIACILGGNVLNRRQQAALTSAYALVNNSFKDYKRKLKELYGQEAHQNIMDALAVEKAEKMNISTGYMYGVCDQLLHETDSEPRLFYDEYSKRYFEATIEQVLAAEYHLNHNYTLRGDAVLNELYEFLGLEPTDYGELAGWAPLDEGMFWIEFNHRKVKLEDGLECYILEMPFEPTIGYADEWIIP